MDNRKRIAVAGATGRVGHHVVDVLEAQGHQVVAISRASGVDVITGQGLIDALAGVDCIVDAATGPSAEQQPATEFFTTAAANLQQTGERSGVKRIVVVSIIGCDRLAGGYGAAKLAHERSLMSGPIPTFVLRAAQFHEFVERLVDWGRQGEVSYVADMRTQLVAARSVAEKLAQLTTAPEAEADGSPIEIAGPREESMLAAARLLAGRRGEPARVEPLENPDDPDQAVLANDMLPGPDAILAGPTFEEWLESQAG